LSLEKERSALQLVTIKTKYILARSQHWAKCPAHPYQ